MEFISENPSASSMSEQLPVEQLPVDLLTRFPEYTCLSKRILLARSSTTLLKLITKDCTALWATIEFVRVPRIEAHALIDNMLAGLLTRVNALEVTKFLSLYDWSREPGWSHCVILNAKVDQSSNELCLN